MQIIPHRKQDWLRVVFPFKAYVFIGPILCLFVDSLPRPRHIGDDVAVIPLVLLCPCGLILLLAALLLGIFGQRRDALLCIGFGIAAFIICALLLPMLATA